MNPAGPPRGRPHQGNRKNRAIDHEPDNLLSVLENLIFSKGAETALLKIRLALLNTSGAI
jgi:hypothetical protein